MAMAVGRHVLLHDHPVGGLADQFLFAVAQQPQRAGVHPAFSFAGQDRYYVIYLGAPRTMRGPALLLGRIVSGGCWRADPAARSRASPADDSGKPAGKCLGWADGGYRPTWRWYGWSASDQYLHLEDRLQRRDPGLERCQFGVAQLG
jgi:hypothetical protein